MSSKPVVSCIITTYNRKDLLKRCLISIINQEYKKYEIIVIDDASTDGTYKFLQRFIKKNLKKDQNINIIIIRNRTPKFAAESRNIGAKFARGKYLFFIDDDVELDKNCIKELVDFMETRPNFVASTPLIHDTKGKVWNAGVRRAYLGFNFSHSVSSQEKYIVVDECITAYIISKKCFDKIGGYNGRFKFYYEESEMFHRLKKTTNKKIACVLGAKAYHHIQRDKLWKISPQKAYLLGRNRVWFYKGWCSSTTHYILCVITWVILCTTFYLMNFIKHRNLNAFKFLMRGVKDGLFTLP